MTAHHQQLEAALCAAYREESALYTQALRLAEGLLGEMSREGGIDATLGRIDGLLQGVAAVEQRIAGVKQKWHELTRTPGPELQAMLAEVASLIKRLAGHTEAAEQAATAHKNRLMAELDRSARTSLMRRAYGG